MLARSVKPHLWTELINALVNRVGMETTVPWMPTNAQKVSDVLVNSFILVYRVGHKKLFHCFVAITLSTLSQFAKCLAFIHQQSNTIGNLQLGFYKVV